MTILLILAGLYIAFVLYEVHNSICQDYGYHQFKMGMNQGKYEVYREAAKHGAGQWDRSIMKFIWNTKKEE